MCCQWCTRWSVSNILEVFTALRIGSVCVDQPFGSFHCPGDRVSLLTGHLEVFSVLGMGSVCVDQTFQKFSLSWRWSQSVLFLSCLCWPAIWCGTLSSSLNNTRAGESVCSTCRKGMVRNLITCYFSNWSPLNSTIGPASQLCWKALSCW